MGTTYRTDNLIAATAAPDPFRISAHAAAGERMPPPFTLPPSAGLTWCPSYRIGIDRIDEQHRGLFALHDDFVHAVERGGSAQLVDQIADELLRYADFHFHAEEEVMARLGYDRLDHHHTLHNGLRQMVGRLHGLPRERTSLIVVAEFVKQWIRHHMLAEDQDLARFVRERGG